jgi:uncharacterized protein YdcH (DUF465 family)
MSKTIRKPRSAHADTKDAAARRRAAHVARMKREKEQLKDHITSVLWRSSK